MALDLGSSHLDDVGSDLTAATSSGEWATTVFAGVTGGPSSPLGPWKGKVVGMDHSCSSSRSPARYHLPINNQLSCDLSDGALKNNPWYWLVPDPLQMSTWIWNPSTLVNHFSSLSNSRSLINQTLTGQVMIVVQFHLGISSMCLKSEDFFFWWRHTFWIELPSGP